METEDTLIYMIPSAGVPRNLVADSWAMPRRRGPAVGGRYLRRRHREACAALHRGKAATRACFPARAGFLQYHQPPRLAGRRAAGHDEHCDHNARPRHLDTGHI